MLRADPIAAATSGAARRTAAEGIEARGTAAPAVAEDIALGGIGVVAEDIGAPEDIVFATAGIGPGVDTAMDIVAEAAGMCRAEGIAAAYPDQKREL